MYSDNSVNPFKGFNLKDIITINCLNPSIPSVACISSSLFPFPVYFFKMPIDALSIIKLFS